MHACTNYIEVIDEQMSATQPRGSLGTKLGSSRVHRRSLQDWEQASVYYGDTLRSLCMQFPE